MSGAEALVAAGLASNVLQFIDFTTKLCITIKDISRTSSGLPKELDRQASQLSHLLGLLKELAEQRKTPILENDVLGYCKEQAQELALLLKSFEGGSSNGRLKNAKLAYRSLRQKEDIAKLQASLNSLLRYLSLQLQIESKHADTRMEARVSELLEVQSSHLNILHQVHSLNTTKANPIEETRPIWMVPIDRNPNFVGRDKVLEQLETQLGAAAGDYCRTAALYGLGGIGKSQIVLEYIFRHKSTDTAVLWVHAGSTTRFAESYRQIASGCQIPGRDDPNVDTLQIVRNWMSSACPVKWTMVVDNVDDRATFFEATSETGKALIEYIPSTAQGTIIYTTRSRDIAIELSPTNDPIAVESLSFDEAQALLSERLVRGNTKDDLFELFEALEYLPLGLSHAAAYMIKRRKNVADYLHMIKDDSTKSQLLSQKCYHHGRAERSSESVISTWWVTFRSIKRENSRAADLLAMMSLLDRHKIPLSILRDPDESSFDFEEAVNCLEAFSLITMFSHAESRDAQAVELLKQGACDRRGGFFAFGEMHRLVQQSTKAWLGQRDISAAGIATKSLKMVWDAFPSSWRDTRTWPLFDLMYPHAKALLSYNMENFGFTKELHEKLPDNLPYRTLLLYQISAYLYKEGRYTQSEQSASICVQIRKMYLGDNHIHTLKSMELYAKIIYQLRRREEAYEIQHEVVRGKRSLLGDYDPATSVSLNNLNYHLYAMGNYADAEKFSEEALLGQRRYCLEHPNDHDSQRSLMIAIGHKAFVLERQGEPRQALNLLYETVELGKINHLDDTLYIQCQVNCYGQLGNYQEARSLMQPLIHGRRELYGETHPETLLCHHLYSKLLRAEGQYNEAEEVMQGLCKAWVGTESGDTKDYIDRLHVLGMTQYDLGGFQKAEVTFRQILATIGKADGRSDNAKGSDEEYYQDMICNCLKGQRKLGDAEVDIPRPRHNISVHTERKDETPILEIQGPRLSDDIEAEVSLREELQMRGGQCGSKGDDRDIIRLELARCLYRQQRHEEASQLGHDVLAWRKRSSGIRNNGTHEALRFLAECSDNAERYDESINHWQQLLLWQRYRFGSNSFETYTARCAIARLSFQQAEYEDAEKASKEISAMELTHPNECDPKDIAYTFNELGRALYQQDKFAEAEDAFRQAYNRYVELANPKETLSANIAPTLLNLGLALYFQDKFEEAEDAFRQAYARYLELPNLNESFSATIARTLFELGDALYHQDKFEEAEDAFCQAYSRYSELTHPSETDSKKMVGTIFWLGCAFRSQGKFREAEYTFRRAYDRHVELYGKYHADSIQTLINLVRSVEDQEKTDQAAELYHLIGTTIALPLDEDEDELKCLSDDEKDSDWITEDDEYSDDLAEDKSNFVAKGSLDESDNGSS